MTVEGAMLRGRVTHGDGRGRQFGFPTANVELDPDALASLQPGVYAALVRWDGQPACGAVVNVGTRPTFAGSALLMEVHVLEFAGDLYGRQVKVELLRCLRPEQRFPSVAALVAQIRSDAAQARGCVQAHLDTLEPNIHAEGGQASGTHR